MKIFVLLAELAFTFGKTNKTTVVAITVLSHNYEFFFSPVMIFKSNTSGKIERKKFDPDNFTITNVGYKPLEQVWVCDQMSPEDVS